MPFRDIVRSTTDGQNYRISLSNEEVRDYAVSDQLDPLIGADQVCLPTDVILPRLLTGHCSS